MRSWPFAAAPSAILMGTTLLCGCARTSGQDTSKPAPPATVANRTSEANLAAITLSPEAESRLGIELATIEERPMSLTRSLGGDLVVPPGAAVKITAPVTGTLSAPASAVPTAGSVLPAGQALFVLTPLLSPERDVLTIVDRLRLAEAQTALESSRVDAQAAFDRATVQVQAAQVAQQRAERLVQDKAGSARALDEANAALHSSEKDLEAARIRRELLARATLDTPAGPVAAISITAPREGVLQSVHVSAGQTVVAGTELAELVGVSPLWVRVPVYVGLLSQVVPTADVQVSEPGGLASIPARVARAVAAPPAADASAATADLFYEIENRDRLLRPGQRVAVTLQLRSEADARVVAWSALLHDIHGGTWVYENVSPHVFVRRRVQVRRVFGATAEFASGPPPGTKVVITGAAELFGTEFGIGK